MAETYKVRIKADGDLFAALKRGETLDVRVKLVFTPTGTSTQIHEASTVKLRLAHRHARSAA